MGAFGLYRVQARERVLPHSERARVVEGLEHRRRGVHGRLRADLLEHDAHVLHLEA